MIWKHMLQNNSKLINTAVLSAPSEKLKQWPSKSVSVLPCILFVCADPSLIAYVAFVMLCCSYVLKKLNEEKCMNL